MTTYDDDDYAACVTCYLAIAIGVDELDADDATAYLSGVERERGYDWFNGDAVDGWFSWSPCDVCRRPLGGDRYAVTLAPVDVVTHTTITRYRYSSLETHGHTSYQAAYGFAQSRLAVNGVGNVSVQINRLSPDTRFPDGVHGVWLETLGGIRD